MGCPDDTRPPVFRLNDGSTMVELAPVASRSKIWREWAASVSPALVLDGQIAAIEYGDRALWTFCGPGGDRIPCYAAWTRTLTKEE